MHFDLILRGGAVVDGTGAPALPADVGVLGARIEAVGDLQAATADTTIDASGAVVTPGLIDVHTHTDVLAFLPGHDEIHTASLLQGVTTEICGNCGFSPFPADPHGGLERDPYLSALGAGVARPFARLADFRAALDEHDLPVNRAPLVGHATLRAAVVGYDDRPPTLTELDEMRRLLEEALDDGALGMSTGLVYPPGQFADTDELIALAEVLARRGRRYTSHLRDELDHVVPAVEEALRIGREGGVGVQISHHKVAGARNLGHSERTLALIEQARADGIDVTVDVYPYTAASTLLAALLPPWANAGTPDERATRLRDHAVRDRIARQHVEGLAGWQDFAAATGWDRIVLTDHPAHTGRTVAELADGASPWDVVCDLLLELPTLTCVLHMMDEVDVTAIAGRPYAMVGSDGLPTPGRQHPRVAGAMARAIATASDLPDRIRRMTSLPAETFGLAGRGVLRAGAVADLVVSAGLSDEATYEDPWRPPSGVRAVVIGGRLAVAEGRVVARDAGAVLGV